HRNELLLLNLSKTQRSHFSKESGIGIKDVSAFAQPGLELTFADEPPRFRFKFKLNRCPNRRSYLQRCQSAELRRVKSERLAGTAVERKLDSARKRRSVWPYHSRVFDFPKAANKGRLNSLSGCHCPCIDRLLTACASTVPPRLCLRDFNGGSTNVHHAWLRR